MLAFKIHDALTDQIEDLSVSGATFIPGNIVQFVVELRVDLNAKMFVVLVTHNTPQSKLNISLF